jgi:hypothetical protein
MPYANEHAARLRDPDDFVRILQLWAKEGIRGLGGPLKSKPNGGTVEQAIRFNAEKWTVEAAKKWLEEHGYKPIQFEPATGKKDKHGHTVVPANAFCCEATVFELGENGEDAKTAPVRLVARTGKPISHWYWGKLVHDLVGVHRHKSHLPIDYLHDPNQVIGYLNRFDVVKASEDAVPDLVCSGALVPYKGDDRATEIIHKARAGVPYEASIYWGGEGVVIEEVGEGAEVEVNGYKLAGPATVIRKWPLRGVAVCPYGADMNTKTQLGPGEEICVTVLNPQGEETMGEETNAAEAPVKAAAVDAKNDTPAEAAPKPPAVDAGKAVEAGTPAVETALKAGQGSPAAPPAPPADGPRAELQRFVSAFGATDGPAYYLAGTSFEAAQIAHSAKLAAENVDLKKRLAAVDRGGAAGPVSASPAAASSGPEAGAASGKGLSAGEREILAVTCIRR